MGTKRDSIGTVASTPVGEPSYLGIQNLESFDEGERHLRGDEPIEIDVVAIDKPLADYSEDPIALRADIEKTRSEMTDTVDSITERLEPHRIMSEAGEHLLEIAHVKMDRAKAMMEDAFGRAVVVVKAKAETAAHAAHDMGEIAVEKTKTTVDKTVKKAKENPVQTALIGIGVIAGMLMIRAWRNRQSMLDMEVWECERLD